MMKQLTSIVCRLFFITSFVLAGSSVSEKLANLLGLTLLRVYSPWRLMEFSVVALLFVIALQLRQIKMSLDTKGSNQAPDSWNSPGKAKKATCGLGKLLVMRGRVPADSTPRHHRQASSTSAFLFVLYIYKTLPKSGIFFHTSWYLFTQLQRRFSVVFS